MTGTDQEQRRLRTHEEMLEDALAELESRAAAWEALADIAELYVPMGLKEWRGGYAALKAEGESR